MDGHLSGAILIFGCINAESWSIGKNSHNTENDSLKITNSQIQQEHSAEDIPLATKLHNVNVLYFAHILYVLMHNAS